MTEPTTHTLEVPGVALTYDVREGGDATRPALLPIGSPMGAVGFVTLAEHFADRTVVTYGAGPGMARFIALVSHQGPLPADYVLPEPDPAMFGLPSADDGSRDDPLLGQNLISCTHYQHDLNGLATASTRIVLATGTTSAGTLASRAAVALAERLGRAPVSFPGGHDGFLGGEFSQTGEPEAFAARLREVLGATA
jgi:hypothetical protein